MTNPKITRKEAQEAFAEVIDFLRAVESQTVVMPTTAKRAAEVSSILRQCRIIEPGGLDAETQVKTLREAADDADKYYDGTITSGALRDYADAIEKGE